MNQGKLEVVKQEMARMNIDILEIYEIKWTGTGKFNSDDPLSTTVGKNPLEEMEQPSQSTKESKMQYLDANDRMISVRSQGKPFNITVIQVYAPTTDAEEAEVNQFYYLTYMQSTSCKMPGWINHKLESRLPRKISTTSDMQMIPF